MACFIAPSTYGARGNSIVNLENVECVSLWGNSVQFRMTSTESVAWHFEDNTAAEEFLKELP